MSINDIITTNLQLRYVLECEQSNPDSVLEPARLKGSEVLLSPGIDFTINQAITFGPQVRFERRFADRIDSRFIWEARDVYEVGFKTEWSPGSMNLSLWSGYRSENISHTFETLDNRSFKINGEITFSPVDILTLNFFTDYHYRRYYPFTGNRISENLTLSGSVLLNL